MLCLESCELEDSAGPDPSQSRASRPLLSRCHSKFSQRLQNAFLKPRLAGCVRGNLSSDRASDGDSPAESTAGHGPTVTVNLNLTERHARTVTTVQRNGPQPPRDAEEPARTARCTGLGPGRPGPEPAAAPRPAGGRRMTPYWP
jgi:hypothetical protein